MSTHLPPRTLPMHLSALSEWEQFEALVCPQHQVAKGLRVRAFFPLLVWHSSSNTSWEPRQQEIWPGHILSNRQLQRAADSPNTQGLAASLPTRSLGARPGCPCGHRACWALAGTGWPCGHRVLRAPAGTGWPSFLQESQYQGHTWHSKGRDQHHPHY